MQVIIRQAIALLPGTKHQLQLKASTKQGDLNVVGDLNFPAQMQAIPQTSFEADFANIMTNAVANIKLTIASGLVNEIMKQLGNEQTQAQTMLNSLQNAGAVKIENNLLILNALSIWNGDHYGIPIQQNNAKLNTPATETPHSLSLLQMSRLNLPVLHIQLLYLQLIMTRKLKLNPIRLIKL